MSSYARRTPVRSVLNFCTAIRQIITGEAGSVAADKGNRGQKRAPLLHRHRLHAWLYLGSAITTEVTGTVILDFSEGFQLPAQTTAAMALYAFSFFLLTRALRAVPLSVAYATWSGLGTVAVAFAGAIIHGEAVTLGRITAITAVIGGIVILNLATTRQHSARRKDV
jgi:multidrug transporter EmrE-like cation transporter